MINSNIEWEGAKRKTEHTVETGVACWSQSHNTDILVVIKHQNKSERIVKTVYI